LTKKARTFVFLGHTRTISCSELSDEEMAGTVRMLLRSDVFHEAICVGARDRILCLTQENTALRKQLKDAKP
jgi:hypothetical protein